MRNTTQASIGAKEMRGALKFTFPNIKFAVTSKSYSGGNSINVSWNFGPTEKEVQAIAYKWQAGNFNGMEDIYEYNDSHVPFTDVDGKEKLPTTVKYVFCEREYKYDVDKNTYNQTGKEDTVKALCALHGKEYKERGNVQLFDIDNYQPRFFAGSLALQVLDLVSFPSDNIKIDGVVHDPKFLGELACDGYLVQFTDLNKKVAEKSLKVATEPKETTGIEMVTYSEKSFAIIGDTKAIKDTLKGLGGKFNMFLKHPSTGEKMIGWIFPQTKAELVQETIF